MHVFSRATAGWQNYLLAGVMAVFAGLTPGGAQASPAGDALGSIGQNTWVYRSLTLRDAGLADPVTLSSNNARQEFFFPVPRGVALSDAQIQFHGSYLKGTARFGGLAMLVNDRPVRGHRILDGAGQLDDVLPVAGGRHETGFVRLAVDWSFNTDLRVCEIDQSRTNALTVDPDTTLRYRYDLGNPPSLESAWGSLPHEVVLTVPGRSLDAEAFDSAWRLGVALERSGRRVTVQEFPMVGSTIALGPELVVPVGLSGIPAFDALRGVKSLTVRDEAQLAALLVLDARTVVGDVVLTDAAFAERVHTMAAALKAQLQADPDALAQYQNWLKNRVQLPFVQRQDANIAVALLGAHPFVAVKSNAGVQAASLFDAAWKGMLKTASLNTIQALPPIEQDRTAIALDYLGGDAVSLDVLSKGDWFANFPLGAVVVDGRVPEQLLIDVSAAPGASSTRPVASVFWNGILLAAERLRADGHPERLVARVPGYALGVTNSVRVSFQRQPLSVDCNEVPQGYPVSVLPSSYVNLGVGTDAASFLGVLPKMAGAADLIIPASYLQHAADSLEQVVRLGSASALSPWGTRLVLAEEGKSVTPERPFLSMEVPITGTKPRIVVDQDHLQINGKQTSWLDVVGLENLSAAEVAKGGDHIGILWHALGAQTHAFKRPFVLNRGDLVVIGDTGPVVWIDSENPSASLPPGAEGSPFFEWRNYLSWGIPVGAFVLFLILLTMLMARRASRKRRSE